MKLIAPITFLTLAIAAAPAFAQSGTRIEHHAMQDFLAGELEGLSVGPVGELHPAPVGLERLFTPSLYIWCMAIDRRGRLVAGAGDDGGVVRVQGDEVVEMAKFPGEIVLDVVDAGDGLLAATGPEGRIYRVTTGDAQVVIECGETSAWALERAADGRRWLAGVGPDAALHRFDPGRPGQSEVIAQFEAAVARHLLRDDERLWLATQGPSLVLQSTKDADRPDRLRYDAGAMEIPDMVSDGRGGLWILTLDPGDPDTFEPPSSQLLHLPRDGSAEVVWEGPIALISLARTADGALLVGEIGASRIHRVTPDGRMGLWRDFGEGDASALIVDGDTTWIGSSNLGDIFRLTEPKDGRGTFTSEPVATPAVEKWGRLWVEGQSAGVRFSTRSGMRSVPDASWSEWSGWKRSGDAIDAPLADYVQYRISIEDAVVTGVNLSWARRNHPPKITGVFFEESAAEVDWSDPDTSYGNGAASLAFLRRRASVRIEAKDLDGDTLLVDLDVRADGEDRWIPVARGSESLEIEWDTSRFADGVWRARATVRDLHAPATVETPPVVVDNSLPVLSGSRRNGEVLEFTVEDRGSRVMRVDLRIGTEESWKPVEPVDGVTDGPIEDFAQAIPAGVVAVWIRARDAAGNEAVFSPRLD